MSWHQQRPLSCSSTSSYLVEPQKSLICFAISMIIKWRSDKMRLVQTVISAVMYGNGASKQVSIYNRPYRCMEISLFSILCSCTTVYNLLWCAFPIMAQCTT